MTRFNFLIIFLILCSVFLIHSNAYALGSYDLTGVNLTSAGLLTWNNSGFSGDCVANLSGHSSSGGYWGNVGCSTYNSGVNLNASYFDSTQCPLMTDYGMSGTCCFSLNNYNGQGSSHCVPIYYTGGTSWSLTPPGPTLTITSPASGSSITDTSTTLDFSFSNFTIGDSFVIDFRNTGLGGQTAHSDSYTYITTASSGTFSVPFSDFNLFSTETWYLYVKLNDTTYPIEGTYNIFFGVVPADNSAFCGGFTSESTCPASCVWNVGAALCQATPTAPNPANYDFTTQDFGYLGNMFRDVVVFLFFPSQANINTQFGSIQTTMIQKIPFAYYFALKDAFTAGQAALTTGALPTISISSPFAGGTTIKLLDLDSTKTMLGTTEWNLIRTIIGYLLWIGCFLFIWETIHKGNTAKL